MVMSKTELTSFKKSYRPHTTRITIRDRDFSLFVPESLDSFIDQEDLFHDFPLWTKIWESSLILADCLASLEVEPEKKFLEIGCGLGLVGIVASSFGHRVIMTDYNQDALRFARANALLNGFSGLEIKEMDWNRPRIEGTYNYIIGSEITYNEKNFQSFLSLFKTYLKDDGEVILANYIRKTAIQFIKRMSGVFHIKAQRKILGSQDIKINIMLCNMRLKKQI
jgi:2-polyprenyl-3-methyl-5-hydroxy-6-metoxy-1,4-benzoquinol methylase